MGQGVPYPPLRFAYPQPVDDLSPSAGFVRLGWIIRPFGLLVQKDWTPARVNPRAPRGLARDSGRCGLVTTEAPITAADRCDRCGAQAYMRVTVIEGLDLHFCAHHAREHGDALRATALRVVDETSAVR